MRDTVYSIRYLKVVSNLICVYMPLLVEICKQSLVPPQASFKMSSRLALLCSVLIRSTYFHLVMHLTSNLRLKCSLECSVKKDLQY